jgi:hypothetical protein
MARKQKVSIEDQNSALAAAQSAGAALKAALEGLDRAKKASRRGRASTPRPNTAMRKSAGVVSELAKPLLLGVGLGFAARLMRPDKTAAATDEPSWGQDLRDLAGSLLHAALASARLFARALDAVARPKARAPDHDSGAGPAHP